MTYKDAYALVQGAMGHFTGELKYRQVCGLIKHATLRFANETPANISEVTFTMTGARDYFLNPARVGRIWRIESEIGNQIYECDGVSPDEFFQNDSQLSYSGTYPSYYYVVGRRLRITPQPTTGTLRVFNSPIPVMELRDTPENESETAVTGSSASLVVATTVTQNVQANRAGITDYWNGCKLVMESTITNQFSYITSANEGASSVTFSVNPSFSTSVLNNDKFRIEDTLEVPEEFAGYCAFYAAGVLGGQDKWSAPVAARYLADFDAALQRARARGFGVGPGTKQRMHDHTERPGFYIG